MIQFTKRVNGLCELEAFKKEKACKTIDVAIDYLTNLFVETLNSLNNIYHSQLVTGRNANDCKIIRANLNLYLCAPEFTIYTKTESYSAKIKTYEEQNNAV